MKATRRLVWSLCGLAAAAFIVAGLSRITFDVDITRLLPPQLKEMAGYRLFLKNFSRPDEVVIALEGRDPDQVEAAAAGVAEALGRRPDLAGRAVWRAPWEEAPGELTEFTAWALLNQSPDRLIGLERSLAAGRIDATLARTVEKLSTSLDAREHLMGYDPLGLTDGLMAPAAGLDPGASEFASADGLIRAVHARAAQRPADYRQTTGWLERIRNAVAPIAGQHETTIHLGGEPVFVSEISNGMERDMKFSGPLALVLICAVFWLAFRTVRVLPLLVSMLVVIFLLTLAASGLLLGSLTVLSVGFASILIGLTVDFGILAWLNSLAAEMTWQRTARETFRSVIWAGGTTAASFFSLVPCGMPGLAELGLLVGIGVLIGQVVMLLVFPRLLFALRRESAPPRRPPPWLGHRVFGKPAAVAVLALELACLAGLVVRGWPKVDAESGAFRSRSSEATTTADLLESRLAGGRPLGVVVAGRDEDDVAGRLDALGTALADLRESGSIRRFALPAALWPHPRWLQENLDGPARRLAAEAPRIRAAVEAAGFGDDAFKLADGVFRQWAEWAGAGHAPALPTSPAGREIVDRVVKTDAADPDRRCLALGLIDPEPGASNDATLDSLQTDGVFLIGQKQLGRALEKFLGTGFVRLAVIFGLVTFGILAFALKRPRPILLTFLALALGFSALIGAMSWLGLPWNSFTLPALLLSLGTGSDYFIYMMLDLERRGDGDLDALRTRLGQAVLTCGGASTIGFASLVGATNRGLADLGIVCSLALGLNVLAAVFVMPWAWKATRPSTNTHHPIPT